MMDLRTVIFMGPQGAGKGTQANLLKDFFGGEDAEHSALLYTSGDHFRNLAEAGTLTSQLMIDSLTQGQVQPLFLSTVLWGTFFINEVTDQNHLLLDGIPRRLVEAELLDEALEFYKRDHRCVISLSLDDEAAIERLSKRGRYDDTAEGITKRLRWYHEKTQPIIDYYKNHPNYDLVEVDASRDVDAIQRDIRGALLS